MDFENFKEKIMEDIKERLEDAGIDANITTNTVKKLNESYGMLIHMTIIIQDNFLNL